MSNEDVDLIVDRLEDLVNNCQQTRIAEALEDIASILYSINKKME